MNNKEELILHPISIIEYKDGRNEVVYEHLEYVSDNINRVMNVEVTEETLKKIQKGTLEQVEEIINCFIY
jgi:hypothetical protein